MATLFVYNKSKDIFYTASPSALNIRDHTAWTDEAFIHACKELCSRFDLRLIRSFVPLRPGLPVHFSPHHAGLAGDFALLDPCRNLSSRQDEIRRWCVKSGLFSYVQPQYRTPLWIHAEVATAPPASIFVPYPALFPGNTGVYCFILQQSLNMAGFPCLLCGRFTEDTRLALCSFRMAAGLPPEGYVDSVCWQKLMGAVSSSKQT